MGKGAFAAVFGQAMRALPACCREGAHTWPVVRAAPATAEKSSSLSAAQSGTQT